MADMAMDLAESMEKWAQVAQDEVVLSQKSSEDFFQADALRSTTPSRSPATCAESEPCAIVADDSASCAWEDGSVSFVDSMSHAATTAQRPTCWWASKVRGLGPQVPCAKQAGPVKLLSGCSGMLTEAKVFEARQIRCVCFRS